MWRNSLVFDELLSGTEPSKIDRRLKYISRASLFIHATCTICFNLKSRSREIVRVYLHVMRVCM